MNDKKGRKGKKSIWTDELTERLLELWKQGLSAAEIARQLGMGLSRNAVIGKIYRLRHEGKAPARRECRQTETSARAKNTKKPAPHATSLHTAGALAIDVNVKERPAPVERLRPTPVLVERETGLVRDIQDLTERTCRWPIGDPGAKNFCFCGRDVAKGTPYCEQHAAIAYQGTDQRRCANG